MKWYGTCVPLPETFSRKSDIPAESKLFAERIVFRFCIAWIVRRSDAGILLTDGSWKTPTVIYKTFGSFIGWDIKAEEIK